jgi:LPS-assembly lipoprotein
MPRVGRFDFMRRQVWRSLVGASLLGLASCGFKLQGDIQLPQAVRVIELQVSDRQSEFASALARRLRNAGVEVRWSVRKGAGLSVNGSPVFGSIARLRIEQDEFIERIASVSARNVPREYELTYRVQYSFDPAFVSTQAIPSPIPDSSLIESEELALSREFSFDERAVLAKQREREQLRSTLANELAGMVIQRIASIRQ